MNALTAPSDIIAGAAPKWQTRDDVYQVGQLLAMLIKGDARARVRTPDVRGLTCSDHLKEIVYRCLGERRKRYESADELIQALRNPPAALKAGALRSLEGRAPRVHRHPVEDPRAKRSRAAKRAGAIVHGAPTAKTTVVVRGRPNPLQAAGRDAGLKLMEIKRLREKGHRITLLERAPVLAPRRTAAEPMRVLIVEDDRTIADFVAKGLTEAGFAVDVAADGERGLELATSASYDAAIVDLMLPKLDGLALIDRMRAGGVRTPVLILSARRTRRRPRQRPPGRRRRLPDQAVRVRRAAGARPGADPAIDRRRRADPPRRRRPDASIC